ncbi:MAG: DUF1127 domain-containing protein [Pseudomonadota bacterium]
MFFMSKEATKLRKARRELNAMSDRELNDLGISRGDIPAVLRGDHPRARGSF